MNKVKLNSLLNAIKDINNIKSKDNNLNNNLDSDLDFLAKAGFKNLDKAASIKSSSSYKGFIIEDIDQVMSHTAKMLLACSWR